MAESRTRKKDFFKEKETCKVIIQSYFYGRIRKMITTKDFFESAANNIIFELGAYWTIQSDKKGKYVRVPFPSKEDFLNRYVLGLNNPYDELSDYDNISEAEEQQMIAEQKQRISDVHDQIQQIRKQLF